MNPTLKYYRDLKGGTTYGYRFFIGSYEVCQWEMFHMGYKDPKKILRGDTPIRKKQCQQ